VTLSDPGAARRVLAVVVAWNSAAHVARAVASIPPGARRLVVDNASSDGSAEEARRAGAEVLSPGRNLGFGPACNLGAAGAGPGHDAILLLNPDAELEGGEACLGALLATLDSDPGLGAAAPALEGEGQEAFQLRRLPTLGSIAREALLVNRLWPGNRWLRSERYLDRRRDVPFDVEQPAAAALLVRRKAFEAVGGFDPSFVPAWFEDVDLCARLLESGYRIRFVPSARARHAGGSTLRSLPYDDFVPLYARNLLRYASRHGGAAFGALARLLSAAGALLRIGLLPVVRGDHSSAETARGYGRVLRGCLGLGWKSSLIGPEG